MTYSEKQIIDGYIEHLAALERLSGHDIAALSAVTMLHCMRFTRVAGAIATGVPNMSSLVGRQLNELQDLCAKICGILTSAPGPASQRHTRITRAVVETMGMVDDNGNIRILDIEVAEMPDMRLPGVVGIRDDDG